MLLSRRRITSCLDSHFLWDWSGSGNAQLHQKEKKRWLSNRDL